MGGMSLDSLRLTRPDDWHLHLRDGPALATSVPHSARVFARAVAMPNLDPPVTDVAAALAYRRRILDALPAEPPYREFQPLMTLYLRDSTPAKEIRAAAEDDTIIGIKYYPAGATTGSAKGVKDLKKLLPRLELMEELDLPLLLHGEVTDPATDIFDREARFIDQVLAPLRERLPRLRMVLEHITTLDAVDFIRQAGMETAATITVHHLLFNRSHLLSGGIRPHLYCLPVLKRERHRQALVEAATGGEPRFFLGTDSAPHPRGQKESGCGCAGIYSAAAAIELYAQVFEAAGALAKLEAFAAWHGADFYRLPRNRSTIELQRQEWRMPESFAFGEDTVVPIQAGESIPWRLKQEAGDDHG